MFVAPSPKNATATRGWPRSLKDSAAPGDRRKPAADHGVRADQSVLDVVEVHRAAVAVTAPLDLAVELCHQRVRCRADRECVGVGPVRRSDHVAVCECSTDADRDRLLPDRHVQEAGEITCPEALLDLLLEPPDQQHLPQEAQKLLAGEDRLLLDSGHGPARYQRAVWGVRALESARDARRATSGDPRRTARRVVGRTARASPSDEADADRAALMLGSLSPGRAGRTFRLTCRADGLGRAVGRSDQARPRPARGRGHRRTPVRGRHRCYRDADRTGVLCDDSPGGRLGRAGGEAPGRLVGPVSRDRARLVGRDRARSASARARSTRFSSRTTAQRSAFEPPARRATVRHR